jgi:C-terminal processing protease CtpA/Prc
VGGLRRAGVTDLILDLRGNPGGRVSTQEVLLNLLRRGAPAGEVMQRLQGRPGAAEEITCFHPEPEAIRPRRIAILTDGGTASCSEFTISALAAHHGPDLALFGTRTAGKPVATRIFLLGAQGFRLNLVAYRHLNRDGLANWFGGLPCPGFPSPTCAVEPDYAHQQGDTQEACLAAALAWLRTGHLAGTPIQ